MTTDTGPKRGYKHSDITEKVIGAACVVYNDLGHGFLEGVYENALAIELAKQGVGVKQQEPVLVRYDGLVVGEYVADMVVDGKVIVEVKAQGSLDGAHEAQLINYLKATGIEVGLLINFGPRIGIKRRVFDRQ
jgi:GxxExxY protein